MTTTTEPLSLVGVAEVAALTGLSSAAIRNRLHRGAIPEPVGRFGQSPVWDFETIEAWAGPTRTPPRRTRTDAGTQRARS